MIYYYKLKSYKDFLDFKYFLGISYKNKSYFDRVTISEAMEHIIVLDTSFKDVYGIYWKHINNLLFLKEQGGKAISKEEMLNKALLLII